MNPDEVAPASASERLRQVGIDCSALIARQAGTWTEAAVWLRTLPMCPRIREVKLTNGVAGEGLGEVLRFIDSERNPLPEVGPLVRHSFAVYDHELYLTRSQGPVLRRILTAWHAATHRFGDWRRGNDQYFDFGFKDAHRITLLGALTLNIDFDGRVVGLDYSWDAPPSCDATFEGRRWAWSLMTSGHLAETHLLNLVNLSLDYLGRMGITQQKASPGVAAKGKQGSTDSAGVLKPAGWTRAELIDQANHDREEDKKILSGTSFDRIRERAGVAPRTQGGVGPHERFSVAELRKLVREVETGRYRRGSAIAAAWAELLPS